jgi:hypothetical protein
MAVPTTTTVWTADPASCLPPHSGRGRRPVRPSREAVRSGAELAAGRPADAWRRLPVREGAVGPLVFAFAAVRVGAVGHRKAGPPIGVLIRRSREAEPEVKSYVSDGDAATPLGVLAGVACTRPRVADFLEDSQSSLGMAQYEARSWVGGHPHRAPVGWAHLFVALTRLRLETKSRA